MTASARPSAGPRLRRTDSAERSSYLAAGPIRNPCVVRSGPAPRPRHVGPRRTRPSAGGRGVDHNPGGRRGREGGRGVSAGRRRGDREAAEVPSMTDLDRAFDAQAAAIAQLRATGVTRTLTDEAWAASLAWPSPRSSCTAICGTCSPDRGSDRTVRDARSRGLTGLPPTPSSFRACHGTQQRRPQRCESAALSSELLGSQEQVLGWRR